MLVRERGRLPRTLIYESWHRGISLALAASRLRSFQAITAKNETIPVFRWLAPCSGGAGRGELFW